MDPLFGPGSAGATRNSKFVGAEAYQADYDSPSFLGGETNRQVLEFTTVSKGAMMHRQLFANKSAGLRVP